ncbi:hypothetical protein ACJ8OA_06125 [Serratia sp. CY68630]|uniref:hypothetical protein n=1 Tax=Serratia sp. CY68630 TaxID=3383666 RepID=UPI003FA11DBE
MDKLREEFEQWLRSKPHVLNVGVRKSGDYVLKEDQIAWSAWQASRASIVVELPHCGEYDEPFSAANAIMDCTNTLRSIGLSIKGE